MKVITLHGTHVVTGPGSLEYLKQVECKKAMVITGGKSMFESGVIDKVKSFLQKENNEILIYSGISKNPTKAQVLEALEAANRFTPDLFVAVGGGSPIDAAKAVMLFYEHPELNFDNVSQLELPQAKGKTKLIAIPSTSGTASEVTHVTVITYPEKHLKVAIRTEIIRPDIAILDGNLPLTLPKHIVAETGMDALTHALECYGNKTGDTFTDALAKSAAEGIIRWLPISYETGALESRQKMHDYQCMAGMAFSNAGLGMVHGASHAFGGMFNLAHGLANAVILPYSMYYNRKDAFVAERYQILSHALGNDVIDTVEKLGQKLQIPHCFAEYGIREDEFLSRYNALVQNSMMGSTVVNPIKVPIDDMKKFIKCVYYGTKVDF